MPLTIVQGGGTKTLLAASRLYICETCKQRLLNGDEVVVVRRGPLIYSSSESMRIKEPTEVYFFHATCKQFLTRKEVEEHGQASEKTEEKTG